MISKILTIVIALSIFLIVLELIREEKLTFKYASGWLFVSLLATLFSIFDFALIRIGQFFGFELTSNFVFFSLLSVFVFLSLLMTVFLCQQNSHNDTIAQKIGMIEHEAEQLKEKLKSDNN